MAGALCEFIQLELQVGLDVLRTQPQSWQCKRPQIDSAEKIFAKPALANGCEQVAVRPRNQLKVAVSFTI